MVGLLAALDDELVMMLRTPGGRPASVSSSVSANADSGVNCAGFQTIVQPAAIAGPIFRVPIAVGKFQGVMKNDGPTGWHGFFAPAGTPGAIVEHLSNTLTGVSRDATIVKSLGNLGIDVASSTPDGLAQAIQADISLFKAALDAAGLRRQDSAR